jgi:uncharacterized protein YbcV (DUF1398 family)
MLNTIAMTIEQMANASHMGTVGFADVVRALTSVGVESYRADYRQKSLSYFMPDGSGMSLELQVPGEAIAERFDAAGVQAAIAASQRGEIKYKEFLRRSMAAGCVGYWVWLAGKQVMYFGRRGETHVEKIPDAV